MHKRQFSFKTDCEDTMMDIVIPYSYSFTEELKYTIRSLKNLPHRNVYILGDKTHEDVIHIRGDWSIQNAYRNQIEKYLTACKIPEVSDMFIATNDDIFIMKKWKPVYYNKGDLADNTAKLKRWDTYTRSLKDTLNYLQQNNLPTINFETHTPFVYDKTKLKDLIESLDFNHNIYQIRSIYGNTYSIKSQQITDVKNTKNFRELDIISTQDSTFSGEIGKYIKECFT